MGEETSVTIENKIYSIRGKRVMLDVHLAELYDVTTKDLNRAVKRNILRFPNDFMFQLSEAEFENLRFQFGTSSGKHGGRRYLPYVFTEQGVIMLASVLSGQRAVTMSIFIARAFIKMRELLSSNKDLAHKIEKLERLQGAQGEQILAIYSIVKKLIEEPIKPKENIGFRKA